MIAGIETIFSPGEIKKYKCNSARFSKEEEKVFIFQDRNTLTFELPEIVQFIIY